MLRVVRAFGLAIILGGCTAAFGQTLIMNEVSQGEAGNQEYVEFVVVDTLVTYDCQSSTPPCIDIRGWIFDDNSGYHGSSGIAVGAVRFSFDPLWQCVPLGTIILIYNDADPNPLLPAVDISLSDGNCRIVAPISNTNLFESNATTPGAVACSYPATGWTPGGNWANTLLANGGDCARIVDLGGCEVFSVCWGSDNLNNLIYFQGGATSTSSAANTVYYFNGSDPSDPANWTIGCADVPACGLEEQTPGFPNNLANEAFIGQFNNNCTPITPVVANALVDNNAGCGCTGQATASGSGSIPGYTYTWYNAVFAPIGQNTATAGNLCAGTYNVVVSSSIGCTDTAQVVITSSGGVDVTVNSETVCAGDAVTLTALPSSGGGNFLWTPGGQTSSSITLTPASSGNYTVYYALGSCIDSALASVTVNPLPVIGAGQDLVVCEGTPVTLSGQGGLVYSWDNGVTDGVSFVQSPGTVLYTVSGTDANGCTATASVNVTVLTGPLANATFTPASGEAPLDVTFSNLSSGGTSYIWTFGDGQDLTTGTPVDVSNTYSQAGSYLVTLTADNGECASIWTGLVEVYAVELPVVLEIPNVFTPNEDYINDVFLFPSENLVSLSGSILNRWGETVFEFNTVDFFWDGRTNGLPALEGTYFVKYKATDVNAKTYEGHSFLQLVR